MEKIFGEGLVSDPRARPLYFFSFFSCGLRVVRSASPHPRSNHFVISLVHFLLQICENLAVLKAHVRVSLPR